MHKSGKPTFAQIQPDGRMRTGHDAQVQADTAEGYAERRAIECIFSDSS
jgi:hypothetical protein